MIEIATIVTAAFATCSGLWAIRAYKDVDYTVQDIINGRLDVMMMIFVITTTGVSAWHTAMMTVLASKDASDTGLGVAASIIFVMGHVVARFSFRVGHRRRISSVYLFKCGGSLVGKSDSK